MYVRSFADGNGDGVGDLAGVRARLPYLRALGVDALWFNPWYPSPLADAGYDVVDYRSIDPTFGTLEDAESLIAEASELGMRTIVDLVPNHVSNQHAWFREALASPPASPSRERFWFRPGSGPDGATAPNGWESIFGGSAWTRVGDGEWYLHLFAPEQPDLNWAHPDVWTEHEEILRFWFDRGVAGVRVDSAALLVKDSVLPELDLENGNGHHPFMDRDELHDIYRRWRAIADDYDEPRVLVGEVWLADAGRLARYLRPDEMHTAFNFDFLSCPWEPARLRESIESTLASHAPVDAPPTWVLSNHDVTRPVTRYGRADTSFSFESKREGTPTDLSAEPAGPAPPPCSPWRFRALSTCTRVRSSASPRSRTSRTTAVKIRCGTAPVAATRAGTGAGSRSPGTATPRPTASATATRYRGSTHLWDGPTSPSPPSWSRRHRCSRCTAPVSVFAEPPRWEEGAFQWVPSAPSVLAFSRGERFSCFVNFGPEPASLPEGADVLIASDELEGGALPADTTVWLRRPDSSQ